MLSALSCSFSRDESCHLREHYPLVRHGAAAFVFTLGRALCQHGSAPIHVSGLTKHRRNGAEGLRTKRPPRQSKGQFFPGDGFICRDRISRIVGIIEIFLNFFEGENTK